MMRKLAIAAVALLVAAIAVGCNIVDDIRKIRRDMLLDSIVFCSSQLLLSAEFTDAWIATIDVEEGTISTRNDSRRVVQGILTSESFQEFLTKNNITLFEFLDRITECQNNHLERDGYFDLIRPL